MSDPIEIVQSKVEYRCPDCRRTYQTMEDYEKHQGYCNPETHELAKSLVGKWVMSDYQFSYDREVEVGKVIQVMDYRLLGIEGFRISYDFRGYAKTKNHDWLMVGPDKVKVLGSEEEARKVYKELLDSIAFSEWESLMTKVALDESTTEDPYGEGVDDAYGEDDDDEEGDEE